jgi:ankyrin repeat protein
MQKWSGSFMRTGRRLARQSRQHSASRGPGGSVDAAKLLVEKGADIMAVNNDRDTPRHRASLGILLSCTEMVYRFWRRALT